MSPGEIHALVADAFPDAIVSWDEAGRDPSLSIRPDAIPRVMRFLKDDSRTAFDSLTCLSGVDLLDRHRVVYHLFSFAHRHSFVVKADVWRRDPHVPSVSLIWRGARWFEREAYDLIGIQFDGHPDLRRILMPDDWEGHPLRKDFVFPLEYGGIDNRRNYD
ncbi:MAG: NADH-quinone oxidoreductase subunit C [bacterium]